MRKVVSKAARSLGIMFRARKLFDCPRVLKSCFNAYVLSSLKYCPHVDAVCIVSFGFARQCCLQCRNVVLG